MSNIATLAASKCTSLSINAPVNLANEEEKQGRFEIEAYTGQVIDRWWGKLSIAIDGIKSKAVMPVFRDHNHGQIVGSSDKSWKDGSFFVSGKFSGATEAAREARALSEEGFPWQASIGIRALKIMSLDEKTTEVVNGKKLKGPAEIWLESEVFEVSFVPLGADSNTKIITFSKFEEQAEPENSAQHKPVSSRGEEMEFTLENLEKEAPALLTQIRAEAKAEGFEAGKKEGFQSGRTEGLEAGAKAEMLRIKAVSEQGMPGHEGIIATLMYDGKTTGPEAAVQVLAAEKRIRANAKKDLESDAIPPVHAVTPVEAENLGDHLPIDEKAKAKWDKEAKLRSEFGGDYECYLAYETAVSKGQVKIMGAKGEK